MEGTKVGSGLNADVTYTKLTSWFSRSTIFKWFDRYWNVNDLTDVTDVTDVIDMTDVTDVAISTPRRTPHQTPRRLSHWTPALLLKKF